jgi:hypothetical protein
MLSSQRANAAKSNETIGMAIFSGARLFSLFNGPYLRKLVNLLGFTPRDYRTIAAPILTQCYETIRPRVVNQLNRAISQLYL